MARWRRLLATPGVVRLLAFSLTGRLPYGIVPFGLVLLLRDAGHSYAVVGVVVGAYSVALAITIPITGRLVDRFGVMAVLAPLAAGFPAAVVACVALARADAAPEPLVGAAALAGALLPPLGATMRAQWHILLEDPGLRDAAFALESVIQEVTFVVGPLIVAVVASVAGPAEALIGAAAASTIGALGFATAPTARRWRGGPRPEGAAVTALALAPVRTVVLALLTIGASFGVIEVAMPAFAEDHAVRTQGGYALAAFSLGSMAGGVWAGARTFRLALELRFLVSLACIAVLTALLAAAGSVAVLCAIALAAGFPIAPTFAAAYRVIGDSAPAHAATEAFAWTSTAIIAGSALGTAVGGSVIEHAGTSAAFLVAGAVVALAVVLTTVRRRTLAVA